MRQLVIFMFWSLLFSGVISAQPASLSDSLKAAFSGEPSFTARLDTRNSFITGRSARIRGVKAGVTYENVIGYGLGFNWLASDFETIYEFEAEERTFEREADLHYFYFSPYLDYTFYRKNKWYVTIPVQFGIGWSNLTYKDQNEEKQRTKSGLMVSYEPAMAVEYRLLKYLGLGVGVGYRLMIVNNEPTNYQFTSPVYLLKVRVLFSEIYKDLIRDEL
ncbi:outer membrane beta-barrel protein [Halocola ammonii]